MATATPSKQREKGGVAATDTEDVDQKKVHALFADGAAAEGLAGNGFTYRHDWGNKHGSWRLRLNWGAITSNSRVFVAIGEGAAGGPPAGKFLGDAKYTLMNVAPTNGQVGIWVNIDWGSDIRIYVDYLVVNP
jgi:hypothetical protein